MKGEIGTATRFIGEEISTEYYRMDWAALTKAKQVLKRKEHLNKIEKSICIAVVEQGTWMSRKQRSVIYAIWFRLAEAGNLRGLLRA